MNNQVTTKPKLKITANKLIEKRELLLNDIHEYWLRIRAENVALKTYKRKFKMTELYEQIKNMEKSVINTKCMIQAINMGFKTMEQFSNSIYPTIFELQQKQERIQQLRKIPTISPVAKEIIPIAKVSIKRIKDIFLFSIPSVKYIPNSLFLLFIKNLEA